MKFDIKNTFNLLYEDDSFLLFIFRGKSQSTIESYGVTKENLDFILKNVLKRFKSGDMVIGVKENPEVIFYFLDSKELGRRIKGKLGGNKPKTKTKKSIKKDYP